MNNFIYLIILLALATLVVSGQELPKVKPCKLTIEKLPKVHGLRMGMSLSGIKAKFKTLKTNPADNNGLQSSLVRDIPSREFSDIEIITFLFLDGELQSLDIEYKHGTDFSSVADLSSKFSNLLLIPKKSWVNTTMKGGGGGYAIAKCYGFDVKANLFNLEKGQKVVLQVEDTNYKQTTMLRVIKRREENWAKESETKPSTH